MKTKYKFIYFERIPDKNGFYIKNNKLGAYLGVIGYYPPWRQYVFEGYEGCVFNTLVFLIFSIL